MVRLDRPHEHGDYLSEEVGRGGALGGAPGLLAALESEIKQVLPAAEARRDPGTPPLKA